MSDLVTLWFDKDGVLAKYDYAMYTPEFDAPAPWLVRNAHIFRTVEPYANMCEAFKRLYKENCDKKPTQRVCNVRVLTSVADGITLTEHVLDGVHWCKTHLDLNPRDFYATAVSKEDIPLNFHRKMTPFDILLDDYAPNLRCWKAAGGTAIKVINEINSTTPDFPYFYNKPEVDYLYNLLLQIVEDVQSGNYPSGGQIGLRTATP